VFLFWAWSKKRGNGDLNKKMEWSVTCPTASRRQATPYKRDKASIMAKIAKVELQ